MNRFILRFTGEGTAPKSDIERIRSHPEVHVIDTSSRMILVEATPQLANDLAQQLPRWTCTAERTYPVPDTRPKIRS